MGAVTVQVTQARGLGPDPMVMVLTAALSGVVIAQLAVAR